MGLSRHARCTAGLLGQRDEMAPRHPEQPGCGGAGNHSASAPSARPASREHRPREHSVPTATKKVRGAQGLLGAAPRPIRG